MPHYLYNFIEIFGVIGRGTPDDPGSDYGLVCAIQATDEWEALEWGLKVHSDFVMARTIFTDDPSEGRLYRDGAIEGEVDVADLIDKDPNYAVCAVGELPNWIEPWRTCQANGVRPASEPWKPQIGG